MELTFARPTPTCLRSHVLDFHFCTIREVFCVRIELFPSFGLNQFALESRFFHRSHEFVEVVLSIGVSKHDQFPQPFLGKALPEVIRWNLRRLLKDAELWVEYLVFLSERFPFAFLGESFVLGDVLLKRIQTARRAFVFN